MQDVQQTFYQYDNSTHQDTTHYLNFESISILNQLNYLNYFHSYVHSHQLQRYYYYYFHNLNNNFQITHFEDNIYQDTMILHLIQYHLYLLIEMVQYYQFHVLVYFVYQ